MDILMEKKSEIVKAANNLALSTKCTLVVANTGGKLYVTKDSGELSVIVGSMLVDYLPISIGYCSN